MCVALFSKNISYFLPLHLGFLKLMNTLSTDTPLLFEDFVAIALLLAYRLPSYLLLTGCHLSIATVVLSGIVTRKDKAEQNQKLAITAHDCCVGIKLC